MAPSAVPPTAAEEATVGARPSALATTLAVARKRRTAEC
jgi:hypothetical protein